MTVHNQPDDVEAFRRFQHEVIDEFRGNGGVVGGAFDGSDLLLLTSLGARTGRAHTTPLGYLDIDERRVVIASAGGSSRNPDWFHNITANPTVTIEAGSETYRAVASAVPADDRDAVWAQVTAREPGYAEYQRNTTRHIPIVVLQRIPAATELDRARGLGEFIVEVHRWLSAELIGLLEQLDHIIASEDTSTPIIPPERDIHTQLRAHCLTFCEALELHHDGEDAGAFPLLADSYPGLAPTLKRLSDEHIVVARAGREIRELVEAYRPRHGDPGELRRRIAELAATLEAHFAYEERTIAEALDSIAPAPTVE
ncbi:nitroreductase/quinone reductase family protein [Tamaricihabitans halophyticus]|nr:nitroreductase/quinone reductase family protein [Tamaricihabitans halophyticus]